MVLAVWATAVAAGMWNVDLFFTVVSGAPRQHMRPMRLAALFHNPHRPSMAWQESVFITPEKTIFELIDNRGEQYHLTPPQVMAKSLTRLSMAYRTLFPVVVVR
jgi:hypothetical protein